MADPAPDPTAAEMANSQFLKKHPGAISPGLHEMKDPLNYVINSDPNFKKEWTAYYDEARRMLSRPMNQENGLAAFTADEAFKLNHPGWNFDNVDLRKTIERNPAFKLEWSQAYEQAEKNLHKKPIQLMNFYAEREADYQFLKRHPELSITINARDRDNYPELRDWQEKDNWTPGKKSITLQPDHFDLHEIISRNPEYLNEWGQFYNRAEKMLPEDAQKEPRTYRGPLPPLGYSDQREPAPGEEGEDQGSPLDVAALAQASQEFAKRHPEIGSDPEKMVQALKEHPEHQKEFEQLYEKAAAAVSLANAVPQPQAMPSGGYHMPSIGEQAVRLIDGLQEVADANNPDDKWAALKRLASNAVLPRPVQPCPVDIVDGKPQIRVDQMDHYQKIAVAVDIALNSGHLAHDIQEVLKSLLDPGNLIAMAGFMTLDVLCPPAALVLALGLSPLMAQQVIEAIGHLVNFFQNTRCSEAKTLQDLEDASAELSEGLAPLTAMAVSVGAVFVVGRAARLGVKAGRFGIKTVRARIAAGRPLKLPVIETGPVRPIDVPPKGWMDVKPGEPWWRQIGIPKEKAAEFRDYFESTQVPRPDRPWPILQFMADRQGDRQGGLPLNFAGGREAVEIYPSSGDIVKFGKPRSPLNQYPWANEPRIVGDPGSDAKFPTGKLEGYMFDKEQAAYRDSKKAANREVVQAQELAKKHPNGRVLMGEEAARFVNNKAGVPGKTPDTVVELGTWDSRGNFQPNGKFVAADAKGKSPAHALEQFKTFARVFDPTKIEYFRIDVPEEGVSGHFRVSPDGKLLIQAPKIDPSTSEDVGGPWKPVEIGGKNVFVHRVSEGTPPPSKP
jgi:hypothetical protein